MVSWTKDIKLAFYWDLYFNHGYAFERINRVLGMGVFRHSFKKLNLAWKLLKTSNEPFNTPATVISFNLKHAVFVININSKFLGMLIWCVIVSLTALAGIWNWIPAVFHHEMHMIHLLLGWPSKRKKPVKVSYLAPLDFCGQKCVFLFPCSVCYYYYQTVLHTKSIFNYTKYWRQRFPTWDQISF